ncbi:MAG: hypothetical protein ACYDC6_11035 [Acidobacteriaceae bacterium]
MIQMTVRQPSVDGVVSYVERVRGRVLAGIVDGMRESMEGLAWTVADKLQGNPIMSRSGDLLGAVLASPRVQVYATAIRGTVSTKGAKPGENLGLWLEEGTHVPAVRGKLFAFTPPDGETVFTRGHKAFNVKPHPFMNPSLQEYKAQILQTIADRVSEALPQ